MRSAGLLAAVAALVLTGSVVAGNYQPPPGDCCPQWSPKGTQIVYTTTRATGIRQTPTVSVVSASGGPEKPITGIPVGARSPDWKHVLYETQKAGATWLDVANVDGSGEVALAETSGDFAWSPDSTRIAFAAKSGELDVIGIDGKGQMKVGAGPAAMPAWSPNGRRIAYVPPSTPGNVHIVNATGAGGETVLAGPKGASEPTWSPDSTQISFLIGSSIVVAKIGAAVRTFALGKPALFNNGWFPDGKALLYVAEPAVPPGYDSIEIGTIVAGRTFQDELVRLDLKTGERRILSFGDPAVFSPDGTRLAFSNGGECRDREGVYVERTDGTQLKRLTNSCTIRGTAGPDTLHGTPQADVLLGLGGNDRLVASDPGYVGDTLEGGPGNDVLIGGSQQDTLDGGPGDDTLNGGPSGDALIGGPGHDHINGQGGRDVIYAVDGQRDWITCGPNAFGKNGRDVVYADKVDVVASDCEIVHRS